MDIEGFPLLPHEITGADCPGMIVPNLRGATVELVCNECKAITGFMHVDYMRELAVMITAGPLTLNCPHCGALNQFPELDSVDVFICTACGKSVKTA